MNNWELVKSMTINTVAATGCELVLEYLCRTFGARNEQFEFVLLTQSTE